MPVKLYEAIKSSYDPSIKKLGNIFIKDEQLSNSNNSVFYNKKNKKLMVNVAGTKSLGDWGTDAYLLFGHLKDTNRYKDSERVLSEARKKYNPRKVSLTGHSLAGGIVSQLGSSNDKVTTLDPATTLFQKTRSNTTNYRTANDIVSIANANSTRTKTLANPNFRTSILPLDIYKAHDVSNIKDQNIFI